MSWPGKTTLATVRQAVRQRASMESTQFVTDAELNGYIAASHAELYDLLADKLGEPYFAQTREFTTDGTRSRYELPADFKKLLGVDVEANGTPTGWATVHRFQFAERNRIGAMFGQAMPGTVVAAFKYDIIGTTVMFTPTPAAGQSVRLWYVPRLSPLKDTARITITDSNLVAGDSFVIGVPGLEVTLTSVASGGSGTTFDVGGSATATASNLASCINNNADTGITASASGTTITCTAVAGPPIGWYAHHRNTPPTKPSHVHARLEHWQNILDGISGWEEYVVVDAARKALEKEESDVSGLVLEKQNLIRRIESAAENRDAGAPARVSDTMGMLDDGPRGWF